MNTAAERDAATLTFLVTGSGLHIAGIGAPFWGLVVGALALWIWQSPWRSGAVGRVVLRRTQR